MIDDQASQLRKRMQSLQQQTVAPVEAQIIGIVSGKGGVGKSVLSMNFSMALLQLQKKVLIIDLDVGMGNIEQLIGRSSLYHIDDCIRDRLPLMDAIYRGPGKLAFIPGGSGFEHILEVREDNLRFFLKQIDQIRGEFDYILFDFGAGVSAEMLHFVRAVNQLVLITTPEPPAIADAYSALKLICAQRQDLSPFCVVNQVTRQSEGSETWQRLAGTARRFLNIELRWLAALHHDSAVIRSVKEQIPCIISYPRSRFSADMKCLAANFVINGRKTDQPRSPASFSERVLHYFRFGRR